MRAVVQRVSRADVTVADETVGAIREGLMVLLGVGKDDGEEDARWLAEKIAHLRIFTDENDKLNRSVLDVGGSVLAVSQFTLYGDCRKGRRPSFTEAARPEAADGLYVLFCEKLRSLGVAVEQGRFQTHMHVTLTNDGPVTLVLTSPREEERNES